MKNIFTLLFLITTPFFLSSQVLWDDFEQTRVGYYDFVHGGMTTRYANPDVNNAVNYIPSGNITMKGVEFKVKGEDNLGNVKIMKPGKDYKFPGTIVKETKV